MSLDPITIWAVKVKQGGLFHQLVALAKILGGLVVILAAVAALQIYLCHDMFPDRPALECLRAVLTR